MLRRTLTLLVHLAAALAPMALGWGVGDLPQFFANPARAGLVAAVCAGALEILILRIDLNPLRANPAKARIESWMLATMAAASILLLAFLPYADHHHILEISGAAARWLGLILCATGGVIRILALRQLGPQFSAYVTLQPEHQLVQSGIYARIRHPLYLSLLLAGPGVALVFASKLVWPILTVTVFFVANRIDLEEALLAEHFGEQFDGYRRSSSTLLPLPRWLY
jgi:protein-S-isoprenylcysteine O-methyltransferase Ste14